MTKERYEELAKQKQTSLVKTGYRAVLFPHFEKRSNMTAEEAAKVDRDNSPIEFDMLHDINVSASSSVTSYPTVKGDSIADHMVRQPMTVSLSGTFSMHGNKPSSFKGQEDRLTNVESFFERLKDEAVMCTIVTMDRASSSSQRYKTRDNMVLTSISWTESQASLSFSLSFAEALTVEMQEVTVDYSDENVPSITDAATLDFTDTLLDWSKVTEIVISQLHSLGLLEEDFWQQCAYWLKTTGEAYFTSSLIGTAVGATALVLLGIASLSASIPIAGWVLAGLTAFAAGIYSMYKFFERRNAEREFNIKAFKLSDNEAKNEQEFERFVRYISGINEQLSVLEDAFSVYGISANEEQNCCLYIDDSYYQFKFRKESSQTSSNNVIWSCNISSVSDNSLDKGMKDIAAEALSDISQCTSMNAIFRTNKGYGKYVYFVNKDLFAIENATYSSTEERSKAIANCNNDLTHFCIFISSINMDEFNDKLRDVVINAMKR